MAPNPYLKALGGGQSPKATPPAKPNKKKTQPDNSILRDEVRKLGGDDQDYALVNNVESESELEDEDEDGHQGDSKTLLTDLRSFVKGLDFKAAGANAPDVESQDEAESEAESESESESDKEEEEVVAPKESKAERERRRKEEREADKERERLAKVAQRAAAETEEQERTSLPKLGSKSSSPWVQLFPWPLSLADTCHSLSSTVPFPGGRTYAPVVRDPVASARPFGASTFPVDYLCPPRARPRRPRTRKRTLRVCARPESFFLEVICCWCRPRRDDGLVESGPGLRSTDPRVGYVERQGLRVVAPRQFEPAAHDGVPRTTRPTRAQEESRRERTRVARRRRLVARRRSRRRFAEPQTETVRGPTVVGDGRARVRGVRDEGETAQGGDHDETRHGPRPVLVRVRGLAQEVVLHGPSSSRGELLALSPSGVERNEFLTSFSRVPPLFFLCSKCLSILSRILALSQSSTCRTSFATNLSKRATSCDCSSTNSWVLPRPAPLYMCVQYRQTDAFWFYRVKRVILNEGSHRRLLITCSRCCKRIRA